MHRGNRIVFVTLFGGPRPSRHLDAVLGSPFVRRSAATPPRDCLRARRSGENLSPLMLYSLPIRYGGEPRRQKTSVSMMSRYPPSHFSLISFFSALRRSSTSPLF